MVKLKSLSPPMLHNYAGSCSHTLLGSPLNCLPLSLPGMVPLPKPWVWVEVAGSSCQGSWCLRARLGTRTHLTYYLLPPSLCILAGFQGHSQFCHWAAAAGAASSWCSASCLCIACFETTLESHGGWGLSSPPVAPSWVRPAEDWRRSRSARCAAASRSAQSSHGWSSPAVCGREASGPAAWRRWARLHGKGCLWAWGHAVSLLTHPLAPLHSWQWLLLYSLNTQSRGGRGEGEEGISENKISLLIYRGQCWVIWAGNAVPPLLLSTEP
jgi:hypothetical protein